MIDIIKETMLLLFGDGTLMKALKNNKNALCRIRSPAADISPRVEVTLMDDHDGDAYDNKPTTYSADMRFSIYKDDSLLFDIGSRINDILNEYGFERLGHTDGFDYNVNMYAKIMTYRCKILIEGDEYSWLK